MGRIEVDYKKMYCEKCQKHSLKFWCYEYVCEGCKAVHGFDEYENNVDHQWNIAVSHKYCLGIMDRYDDDY